MNKEFLIYTDGACIGNGKSKNIGGWSYCIVKEDVLIHESVSVEFNTTNNRQELSGVINALIYCKKNSFSSLSFDLFSDSQYVVKGFNEWMHNWRRKGWVKEEPKIPIPNADLWKQLFDFKMDFGKISLIWVKGHAGNKWNERADRLIEIEMAKY